MQDNLSGVCLIESNRSCVDSELEINREKTLNPSVTGVLSDNIKTEDVLEQANSGFVESFSEQEKGLLIGPSSWVILLFEDGKKLTVKPGLGNKGTHFGQVDLTTLEQKTYGQMILTSTGHPVYLLKPTLQDHIMTLKRITQIIYPKDIGTILLKLGISQGSTVLECGTGSGSLTTALAWMVGDEGKVYTYERDPLFSKRAKENLDKIGLLNRVEMKIRDVSLLGFEEKNVEAAFLDVREPTDLLPQITASLAPGGVLGILVPTTNQIVETLNSLSNAPYTDTEIMETFFRKYKNNPNRLRPEDRMVGHTGFLIFTRRVSVPPPKVEKYLKKINPDKSSKINDTKLDEQVNFSKTEDSYE